MLRSKNKLKDCVQTYNTPTSSDNSIRIFHKWKKRFPQKWSNMINSYENRTLELTRKEVFDRYNDHTKFCTHCLGALKNIEKAQFYLPILIFIHSLYFCNYYENLLSVLVYFMLQKFRSYFIFRDYVHNEL